MTPRHLKPRPVLKRSLHSSPSSSTTTNLKESNALLAAIFCCYGLAIFVALGCAVTAIIIGTQNQRALAVKKYCLQFAPLSGTNASGSGFLEVDKDDHSINWEFDIGKLGSSTTSIAIMGPLDSTFPIVTSSLFKNLTLRGEANVHFEDIDSLSSSQTKSLTGNPSKYYLLLRTTAHPQGATRANLGSLC